MHYYNELGFIDRHPLVRLTLLSVVIGLALSVFLSGLITACQWASGMPFPEALDQGKIMVALLTFVFVPGIPGLTLMLYLRRVMPEILPQNEGEPTPVAGYVPNKQSLAEQVRQSAIEQARWKYESGQEPTRSAMCTTLGWMNQPLWNSGRTVLTAMGIVDSKTWVQSDWNKMSRLVSRIGADDDRIWYPSGTSGLSSLTVIWEGDNNSYITDRPTPESGSGQFKPKTPVNRGTQTEKRR